MNETEVENFIDMDIWDLPLLDRWRLFQFWQHKAVEELERKIAICDENYQKTLHDVNGLREKIDFEILNKSKVSFIIKKLVIDSQKMKKMGIKKLMRK